MYISFVSGSIMGVPPASITPFIYPSHKPIAVLFIIYQGRDTGNRSFYKLALFFFFVSAAKFRFFSVIMFIKLVAQQPSSILSVTFIKICSSRRVSGGISFSAYAPHTAKPLFFLSARFFQA